METLVCEERFQTICPPPVPLPASALPWRLFFSKFRNGLMIYSYSFEFAAKILCLVLHVPLRGVSEPSASVSRCGFASVVCFSLGFPLNLALPWALGQRKPGVVRRASCGWRAADFRFISLAR